ncbi:MAG: 3-phosphoserine/phosphohydroxythreonine transaminase [Saprospiraceae bacterium]|nr:3-phosphoserine/phosphohydroxythreonine transaminase [Saprospiraceae bacterium]
MKKHNFSSGPAILPAEVMIEAAEAVKELDDIGLSILEISHRSEAFSSILAEAIALVKELLHLPKGYEVLFLTGGASSQFYMTAMNLLDDAGTAAYVDTGSWSTKAIKEASLFGKIEVIASSKDQNFSYIPKGYDVPDSASYLHLTSNNTIYGTQFKDWPETNVPFVCDMSSDIFSQPIDIDRFGLIYAGAQKNLGPSGTTLVIVREDMLGKVSRTIPTMLDYTTHIKKRSAFNTPPTFPIYVCLLTLRWLERNGGVEKMAEQNLAKAQLLYDAIDANPLIQGKVNREDRSLMNVSFVMADGHEDKESIFWEMCEAADCSGIKGHRTVGGFRASIYNAMPVKSIEVLIDVMNDFANKYA